jgi:hypothetical protein
MNGDAAAQEAAVELFRSCVVRISDQGTGFFVAPNCVLTCSHVFPDDSQKCVLVVWQERTGKAAIHRLRTKETPDQPDLALLEVDWGEALPGGHPCVLLGDEAERGQELLAFGHAPGPFFEHGDNLSLEYGWATKDNHGVVYVKARGDRVVHGFSGSPVLNLATRLVCGVVALSVNLEGAEGARIIPTGQAQSFLSLREKQQLYHDVDTRWSDLLPGACLWRHIEENCRQNIAAMRSIFPAALDTFYAPRHFEIEFSSYIAGNKSAIVVVGQSGMGKTTMAAHLLDTYSASGHLCAMIESARLPATTLEVEASILGRLQRKGLAWKDFWGKVTVECARRSKCLILFIDAVNEYQEREGGARPVDIVEKLDGMIWEAFKDFPGLKFVITCRPETWRRVRENSQGRFADTAAAYFPAKGGQFAPLAHELPRFTDDEVADAYGKYQTERNIRTGFAELSELTRYSLRDPLLLSLTTEIYKGKEIPGDLDTGEVLGEFRKSVGERELIDDILKEMFAAETANQDPDVVRRTTITRDSRMHQRAPALYEALDTASLDPAANRLRKRNVLREWSRPAAHDGGATEVVELRFTYDRFAEFLLADTLIQRLRFGMEKTPETAAIRLIRANLDGAQRMNIVFGALQRMLFLLQNEKCDYVMILQSTAEADPRGLGLVVSVLARTARGSAGGIDVLERLLRKLAHRSRWPSLARTTFPLIDAVYRVLQNQEYRLWLKERPPEEQARHFAVLYGWFHWGMRHREATVSATAIQYLSFLWRGRGFSALEDAEEVTRRLIALVNPLSLVSYVFRTGKRRLLQNLTSLIVLIIGEAEDEERAGSTLAAAKGLVLRLRLRESTAFRLISPLNRTLSRLLLSILEKLRNPVKLQALQALFGDSFDANLSDYASIMDIFRLDHSADDLGPRVRHLARTGNSFVLQMLTFALSAYYERLAGAGAAAQCLALLEGLFAEDGAPASAQYCAALALYHVNYFGGHATKDSLNLMGKMAALILRQHKGVFEFGGEVQNFNIIGTYGRALQKNRRLLDDGTVGGVGRRPLEYAIDALAQARTEGDFSYYLYICENVGLLGVLIEPGQVFVVISQILLDIGEIKRDEGPRKREGFTPAEIEEARARVLKSLANIRVLYRQEVDKYLLEELESARLYGEVANNLVPEFSIATFHSWAFEQLMFRFLTRYYDEVGKDLLEAFYDGVSTRTVSGCLKVFVARVVRRLGEISA